MSTDLLPIKHDGAATLVLEPSTGELVELRDATDRAILQAAGRLREDNDERSAFRRLLAAEAARRYAFGVKHKAGYEFKVEQSTSWAKVGTVDACRKLLREGKITDAEFEDAVPYKRVPDGVKCKALAARLLKGGEGEAYKILTDTCSVADPRISKIAEEAVAAEAVDDPPPVESASPF